MQIFLDSSNLDDIEQTVSSHLIDGITTNPSLMARTIKENKIANYDVLIKQLASMVKGPVSIEVISDDYEEMLDEGKHILSLADNIVLKLPTTHNGLKACYFFSSQGKAVNMTLCFSVNQAILAAKAGAAYVSPFVGRLDDIGVDGSQLIANIRTVFDNYQFNTKILAASLRHPKHVEEMALIGADVVTISSALFKQMYHSPMTDKGLETFKSDWNNMWQTISHK